MSNQDQAAQVIRTWQQRHKNAMDRNPEWAAQNLAIDLLMEDLIAPDLPEPSYVVTVFGQEHPVWDATLGFTAEAQSGSSDIKIWCYYEPGESLTLAQARTIRQALHAAENYAGDHDE